MEQLRKVGKYEILAPVGRGGMGNVYKVIDKEKDRVLAIKVLRSEFTEDKKKAKADYLGRENKIASSLEHPNVIDIYEIIEEPDDEGRKQRYLLMEFIEGTSLRDMISSRDWPLEMGIDICIQICRGLDYIHQEGIVHRDIKPENFLISKDGKCVKIADFGLSKSNKSWRMNAIKARTGTPKYMSPEQIAGKDIDFRSDIFSLGLTMFELFTGVYPFDAQDRNAVMRLIIDPKVLIPPPSRLNPKIPPELDRIILKALQKNPKHRYKMVTEMILDLTRLKKPRI